MRSGFLPLGHWWGIPVRMHWTTILLALFLGRFHFVPGLWAGVILLTLIHELGHAFFVRRLHQRVTGIDLSVVGGLCHWQGEVTRRKRAIIAWGGVLAQLAVLIPTALMDHVWGPFYEPFAWQFVEAWTWTNLWTIALNLLPIPPLDGANAWPLMGPIFQPYMERLDRWWRRRRKAQQEEAFRQPDSVETPLSPELQRQLERIADEVHAEALRKTGSNRR